MPTTIVELVTTSRVLVPVTHNGITPVQLTQVAKQAYTAAVERELPFDVCIESLEHGRITGANRPDALSVIQRILDEYHTIKPGLDWYADNGHSVSEGEVMLNAIGSVLQRLGYVMMTHEAFYGKGGLDLCYDAEELLFDILAKTTIGHPIISAITEAISDTHVIVTAEYYWKFVELKEQPVTDIILQEA